MIIAKELEATKVCSATFILALNDTLNVVSGKWKLPIMGALLFGKKRFREVARSVPGITPRMLSKELKDLELNGIVKRTVYDTMPVSVEYELTPSGSSLRQVLEVMVEWGVQHRQQVMGKTARQKKELADAPLG